MKRWILRLVVGLVAVGVGVPMVGVGVVWWLGWDERVGYCDVALVLGNAVSVEGVVSERLRARLDRAVELYRAGLVKKIIASGGVDGNGTDEAVCMARYLQMQGVPLEAVVTHSGGKNSYHSAKFVAEGVRAGRWSCVTVVSQFYHVPRVRMALALFGTPAKFWARPNYVEEGDFFRMLRELVACVRYFFHDYRLQVDAGKAEADRSSEEVSVVGAGFSLE